MSNNGLERASRASRGKRMSKLLNEEVEADDEFWNQEAFKEDAEDNEYATEDEEADTFDSDFDEDEPDDEDVEDVEVEKRQHTKKRKLPPGSYHDKKKKEKKNKKKEKSLDFAREGTYLAQVTDVGDISPPGVISPDAAQISHSPEIGDTILDVDGERSVRKSTRTAVVIKQAEREAHQAALQALSKPVKKKKEEERKISQEEMLLEAAQTEIQNLQALEVMLAREEEVKRKATIQKAYYAGPQIRFHSTNGKNILEFTKVNEFPQLLNSSPVSYPEKILCVVTGLPAKYRDPKSDLPYATKEAFRIIRERSYSKGENPRRKDPLEESHQRKRTKVERERSGPGGRTISTKQKYKKAVGMVTNDDVAIASHPDRAFLKPVEPEVQRTEQLMEQTSPEPVDLTFNSVSLTRKNSSDNLQPPRNPMAHGYSSLDMPGAFLEANEADFMLDDLEVSLPSNLELGLSLPTSMGMSPMLLTHNSGGDGTSDELDKRRLDFIPCEKSHGPFSPTLFQLSDLEGLG